MGPPEGSCQEGHREPAFRSGTGGPRETIWQEKECFPTSVFEAGAPEEERASGRGWEPGRGEAGRGGVGRGFRPAQKPGVLRRWGCGEWGKEQGAGSWCRQQAPGPDPASPGLQGAGPAAARPREGVRPWPSYSKENKARLSCKTRILCQPSCATGPPECSPSPPVHPPGPHSGWERWLSGSAVPSSNPSRPSKPPSLAQATPFFPPRGSTGSRWGARSPTSPEA